MRSIYFLCLLIAKSLCSELPGWLDRCEVELDGQQDCLRNAVDKAIKHLSKEGDAELGLPDLDPLDMGNLTLVSGDGPLNVQLAVSQGTMIGFGGARVTSVSGRLSDPKDFEMSIAYAADRFVLHGLYDISGRIIILPISGNGFGNATFADFTGNFTMIGTTKMKSGKEHIKITNSILNFNGKRLTFNIQNLFNGNKQLGEIMNKFLNDNGDEILLFAREHVEKIFAITFKKIAQNFFNKFAYDDIFIRK